MTMQAELTVDTSSFSGDTGSSGSQQEIINVLKEIRDAVSKDTKLKQTGFIDGLSSLGGGAGLMRLLGLGGPLGLGAAAVGAGIGYGATSEGGLASMSNKGYESGMLKDGSKAYFEIDQTTGDILRTLTEQQAVDEGILDEKAEIRKSIRNINPVWDEITALMDKYKDSIILTEQNMAKLQADTAKERAIAEQIVAARMEILSDLSKSRAKRINGMTFSETYFPEEKRESFQDFGNNQLYAGGVPASHGILQNYQTQRAREAAADADAIRFLRSQMPLVDPTSYVAQGR